MNIEHTILILMILGNLTMIVGGVFVIRWAWERTRARNALVLHLSKDLHFVQEIEWLQQSKVSEQVHKAEITRLQMLILEHMKGLKASQAKLLNEPMTQRSLAGRTGYIEDLARDVKRRFERAAT